ncbi:MAG: HNH nuclease family protein [Gammaproteobacteria bacterium]|nr:HNH nuclease family protein [Gammaproteobacteria bacterium]
MAAPADKRGPEDIVARARRESEARALSYREQALKLFPWVCGRCGREFTRQNVQELTVHHRDHDHDNNPGDGSNWELLCIYCHEDEHARHAQAVEPAPTRPAPSSPHASATFKPFADLNSLLGKERK